VEEVIRTIHEISEEIRICMFGAGAANISELRQIQMIKVE